MYTSTWKTQFKTVVEVAFKCHNTSFEVRAFNWKICKGQKKYQNYQ